MTPLRRLDHVAIAVQDTERALRTYRDRLGLRVVHQEELDSPRVRLTYLDAGNAYVQLVEPLDDRSEVARAIAEHGEGLHHVCFVSDDLPSSLEALAGAEAELIDREPRPGAHGTVAFVHPRTLSGVLWELLEAEP
jgi:methylmalonyl-CoA epimerase